MQYQFQAKYILFLFLFFITGVPAFAQPIVPVTVTGFNHDVVAESGTSSLTTTTSALDGVTVSNKVMYTNTFRTINGFAGGGIPDNGIIPEPGGGNFTLASYTSSNALIVPRSQTASFTLPVPAKYNVIRVLAFSTEGASLINITLNFTDGTSAAAVSNYTLPDWFNGTANVILQGFGRVTRATPATGADAFPSNPRLYSVNIPMTCVTRDKLLASITFSNVTTAGTNAPFPNAVFFAVSGRVHDETSSVTALVTPTCTSTGSAQFNITGSGGPYTIVWNTTPVQTGPIATNLQSGVTYTATGTNGAGCVITGSITMGTDNTFINDRADTTICSGGSFVPNLTSNGSTFSWSPAAGVSNPAILNPVLSPTVTTNYVVTTSLGTCPPRSVDFRVTVLPRPDLTVNNNTTICAGSSFTANTTSNSTIFSWSPVTGVSNPTIANPVLSPVVTTIYTVTSGTGTCIESKSFTVTVSPGVNVSAGNDVTILEGGQAQLSASGSQGTYLWTPSTGLSATGILNPVARPLVTTTYNLQITNAQGCIGNDQVTVTVVPDCIKPMNAITPNGDGINEKWLVVDGNCTSITSVKVYNRYGSLVYENKDYRNDWEGTYKGNPLPDATYYYLVEYLLINGEKAFRRGNVTILR